MGPWDLKGWEQWMTAAGRPPSTIELRRYHVGRLARDVKRPPTDVTVDDLIAWLAAHDWKPHTRRSYRSSFRSYFGWLQASGYRADSPAHLLPPITPPRAKPRPAPEIIFREALSKAPARERLMVALAGMCGLRRGEIARVRREDVVDEWAGRCGSSARVAMCAWCRCRTGWRWRSWPVHPAGCSRHRGAAT